MTATRQAYDTQSYTGTATVVTLTGPRTDGNLLILSAVNWQTRSIVSVVQSGASWVQAVDQLTGDHRLEVWYAENISSAAGSITVTLSTTPGVGVGGVTVAEYSGIATVSSLDVTVSDTKVDQVLDSSGTITAEGNELWFMSISGGSGLAYDRQNMAYSSVAATTALGSFGIKAFEMTENIRGRARGQSRASAGGFLAASVVTFKTLDPLDNPIARVQEKEISGGAGTGPFWKNMDAVPIDGNLLVCHVSTYESVTVTGIAQTNVVWNLYQRVTNGTGSSGIGHEVWFGTVGAGAADLFVLSTSAATQIGITIAEYSGLEANDDSAVDLLLTNTGSSDAPVTGTIGPTTTPKQLVVASVAKPGGGDNFTIYDPLNDFMFYEESTGGSSGDPHQVGSLDFGVEAIGSFDTGFTNIGGSQLWTTIMFTLKAASTATTEEKEVGLNLAIVEAPGPIIIVLGSTPTPGSTLIAVVGAGDSTGGGVTSIDQIGAPTWQLVEKGVSDHTLEIWYTQVSGGVSPTITINLNTGAFSASAMVLEYANITLSSPIDQIASSTSLIPNTSPGTGTTAPTLSNMELWVGGLLTRSDPVFNPTNDFSLQSQIASGDVNTAVLTKIVSDTAQAFVEASTATATEWAGAIAAFIGVATTELTAGLSINIVKGIDTDVLLAFGGLPLEIGMNMWIADSGVAAQLFSLDTDVTKPLIIGDHIVDDPGTNEAYNLANLDEDVVSITAGPNSVGIALIKNFVNNGDGTGYFVVDFNSAIPARQLTLVATDDVDNESDESLIFIVNSFERVRFGDTLSIAPRESVSTSACNRMLEDVPKSGFILKRQHTIPYSFNPSEFDLRAITPGAPITITVLRRGTAGGFNETQTYVVIPDQEVMLVKIRLGRGLNIVSASDQFRRSDTVVVAATTYAAVICSYAREMYNYAQVHVEEQQNAIFSSVSTRLSEPLLSFADLLPDVRSQQTLAAKLAVRSLVNNPGKYIGVRDLLTALTLSTPIFMEQAADNEFFDPSVRPLFTRQESFAGVEAHVWMANQCVHRWLAFISYINNLPMFQVISITENEVVFRDENGEIGRHLFDFTEEDCSLTSLLQQTICFDAITLGVSIFSESDMVICAAAYPLDMRPVPSSPIGQLAGELENTLGLDPGFDGYVDFSVTDHWDSGTPLDSQGAMPAADSGLSPCVYENGYLVSPLMLGSTNTDIGAYIYMSGAFTTQPAVGSYLDVSIDMVGMSESAGLSLVVALPEIQTPMNMVILGEIEKTLGINVLVVCQLDPPLVGPYHCDIHSSLNIMIE